MKPILFNTPMVQAILRGQKTQTRRPLKWQKIHHYADGCTGTLIDIGGNDWACKSCGGEVAPFTGKSRIHAKYCIGDILYVRETWQQVFDPEPRGMVPIKNIIGNWGKITKVKAEYQPQGKKITAYYVYKSDQLEFINSDFGDLRWKPSIHMPKDAARLFLKVTNVKIERLNDMAHDSTYKEGIMSFTKDNVIFKYAAYDMQFAWSDMPRTPQKAFERTWDSIYGKEYPVSDNPYVFVYEFEVFEVARKE